MNKLKFLTLVVVCCIVYVVSYATDSSVKVVNNETYSKSQVDSLVSSEIQRQVDTQLLDLKIQKATNDSLKTYIAEENNHLSFVAIIITILVAIVGIVIPLYINRRYEKLIDEKLKENQEVVNTHVKKSKYDMNKIIEDGLQKLNMSYKNFADKLSSQQDYITSLVRALNNKNEDVKLNMLNELIKKFEKESFVASAYNCRGNIFLDKKEYDRAILDYSKAEEKDPSFADAYHNRGNAYTNTKDFRKAIDDYTIAIELNPDGADYYCSRGTTYVLTENYDQAIEDYKKAIKLNPDCADFYLSIGGVYHLKEDYDMAIAMYTKAIELNPNNAIAYVKRGMAFSQKDNNQYAINDYTKAIELNLKSGELYLFRSDEYRKIGKKAKAKADYKRAMKLGFYWMEEYHS